MAPRDPTNFRASENYLLLKSSVELGTREQRALVRELALSSDVIAVDKVAYNTEMLAGRPGSISWEESQTFLAIDVVTLDLELTVVLLIGVIDEVSGNFTTNKKARSEEVGLGDSCDGDLDWVVVTVLAAHPFSGTSENVARLGWTSGAGLGILVPSVVTVLDTIAQQQGVDALLGIVTATYFPLRVTVIRDGFDVINSVIKIVDESQRIDLLGISDTLCNVS
jgi:hypothetical protein